MREIYLDNAATTKVDRDVAELALEMMCGAYGNPSSLHKKGLEAQVKLDKARTQVAGALGCKAEEICFTASGTEANNLALVGGTEAMKRRGKTIVAMSFEHSSVLSPLKRLEEQGFHVKYVQPKGDGTVDTDAVAAAVDEDTVLVSCMFVNSEVGSITPIGDLATKVRRKNGTALIHCDGVQAFGKIPFSASRLGVDLLSVSAHKIYAPKGCGALYIRKGARIIPQVFGGTQERSLRAGTENTPAACAFGLAAEKAAANIRERSAVATKLCEHFVNKAKTIEGLCINSAPEATPYICNISLPGYRSEILLHYLEHKGIYVSSGSACSKGKPSHVLLSMGLPRQRADSALRVSFSKDNTVEDIDAFFDALSQGMGELIKTK